MANTYTQPGNRITFTAPAAVVKGNYVLLNSTTGFGGVALHNADSAANVVLAVGEGVWTMPKMNAASNSAAIGANAHWDNTNSVVTPSATSNALIGQFTAAITNTQATASVRLRKF